MNIKRTIAHNTVMLYTKKILKAFLCLIFVILCSFAIVPMSAYADENELYLGGFPAGFILNTTTVHVVGVCDVMTREGMQSPARDCGIQGGDIINKINGIEITSAESVNTIIGEDYKKFEIEVIRNNESITFETNAVTELSSGKKRLGLLVKDSINGIGTVTYIDKTNQKFGSLGHPVIEGEKIQKINGGIIYGCHIFDVKKGVRGTPGELKGMFDNGNIIGKASVNCSCGVFGDFSAEYDFGKLTKIKPANIEEVKIGDAEIYTTIKGNEVKKYAISVVKVDKDNKENRNFVIKINDKNLIDATGGIVQGMSGSPIVQNGKLIGAVTHVFVNDPTRGYGIAIENMLSSY